MPFIDFKASKSISNEQELALKTRFGSAITDLGKPESFLMINIEGDKHLYFSGNDGDIAIAEIALFGKASNEQYAKMTADMCQIISEELEISPKKIYIKFEETDHWGWAGRTF